ncbi:hypothetical protein SDC9_131406 [bioreactor metagenome]|uniref:Uncharacterized protein n=1 Tax=bioreactor metagenome TaxID=1076179 RepID=A0A645D540_9ZZZZ
MLSESSVAFLLNVLAWLAQTGVSIEGKIANTTVFPLKSENFTSLPPLSATVKSGAKSPTFISSPKRVNALPLTETLFLISFVSKSFISCYFYFN